MTIEMRKGMSILDAALQYCGSIDYAAEIAMLNDVAVDTVYDANTTIRVPEVKNGTVDKIRQSGAAFCTGGEE